MSDSFLLCVKIHYWIGDLWQASDGDPCQDWTQEKKNMQPSISEVIVKPQLNFNKTFNKSQMIQIIFLVAEQLYKRYCLSVFLSVCLFVRLFVCLFVRLSSRFLFKISSQIICDYIPIY